MRGLWRLVWRAYREYELFRWLAWVVGGVFGLAGALWGGLVAWTARVRMMAMVDAPEYANDITPGDVLPRGLSFVGGLPWPVVLVVLACVGVVVLLARLPLVKPDNPFERDPRRLFDDGDRRWVNGCARNRCEYRTFGLFRCHGKVEELDHWYPWARGGATDRHNLVGLCRRHNRRKSDHVPTILGTWMLGRARMRYFPARYRGYVRPDGEYRGKPGEQQAAGDATGPADGVDAYGVA